VSRKLGPGVNFNGRLNLTGFAGVSFDRVLTGDRLLDRVQVPFSIQVDPSRHLPRLGIQGFAGQEVDLLGVRVGRGADLTATATVRPTDHLALDLVSAVSWLDVEDASGRRARLFTAQVQRLKATCNFSSRMFLRLIGQYVSTRRDPALYPLPVPRREASFSGSALFSYRLNWQTAFFLGYGDDRERPETGGLARTGRQLFVKLSYAFQR
jgi:hypothetical protein